MIAPYAESDPTAFYSAEEFEKAVSTLQGFTMPGGSFTLPDNQAPAESTGTLPA